MSKTHYMKNKKGSGLIKLVIFLLMVAISALVAYIYNVFFIQGNNSIEIGDITNEKHNTIVVEQRSPQTFVGNDRPIAVMIDNNINALPHAGLNKAYAVYEIIVEGGESRLMALFKGQNLSKIGPVRSSRHYFLDYALEHDAIYVHFGWSPQAESDIKSLGVNNINGLTQSGTDFWRVTDKSSPHNAVTSTEKILKMASEKNYRTTSTINSPFNYTVDEVNLEDGISADKITIPYSTSNVTSWEYDENSKNYTRYTKNKKETDWDTGEDVRFKNIIIEFIENTTLNDGTNTGRQTMTTIGAKDGYYITNGKAIKIKCTKMSRTGKTTYTDLEGNEIEINDANTFVEICPINANVKIESNQKLDENNTVNE